SAAVRKIIGPLRTLRSVLHHVPLVMPRVGGASSKPRPLGMVLLSLEYWVARSSRATTSEIYSTAEDQSSIPYRCRSLPHVSSHFFARSCDGQMRPTTFQNRGEWFISTRCATSCAAR